MGRSLPKCSSSGGFGGPGPGRVGLGAGSGPDRPVTTEQFDPNEVKKGATLAAIGNCGSCHTRPGGRRTREDARLKRRLAQSTPPTLRLTRTPGSESGHSKRSPGPCAKASIALAAICTRHFPMTTFTLVSEGDNRALYAFLMTRPPVNAPALENELPFPLEPAGPRCRLEAPQSEGGRISARIHPRAANWNRGAYLGRMDLVIAGRATHHATAIGAEQRSRAF